MTSSKGFLQPRIEPASLMSPAVAGGFFTTSATWEARIGQREIQMFIFLQRKLLRESGSEEAAP